MQTKRVTFRGVLLPAGLVAPQLIITFVFFIWPASQAIYESVLQEDPFGLKTEFVGFANFQRVFSDSSYLESFGVTALFSLSVAALALVVAPSHPWARRQSVGLEEVADCALVTREAGSGTRQTWEDAVRTALGRDAAAPAVVLPTSAAVRMAVAEGLAPALLSALAVADDVRLGRLIEVPLEGRTVARPITALWRGGARDLAATSRELVEVAVETELAR